MSFSSLQNPSRRAFFRLFALSSLAFASVTLLPGCGGKNSGKEEAFEEQNVKAARTQIGLFAKALTGYYLDNKTYPSRLQGLIENVDQAENWKGPYLESIPLDPWGMEYQYV